MATRIYQNHNPTRNVKVCQSCDRTWERWSNGAHSGIEFY